MCTRNHLQAMSSEDARLVQNLQVLWTKLASSADEACANESKEGCKKLKVLRVNRKNGLKVEPFFLPTHTSF